jgi:LPS-assembly protein
MTRLLARSLLTGAVLAALHPLASAEQARCDVGSECVDYRLCGAPRLPFLYPPGSIPAAAADTPADLSADQFDVSQAERYRLTGNVVVTQGPRRLETPLLDYLTEAGRVDAQGPLKFQDSALLIHAKSATVDLNKDIATLESLDYQLTAGRGNGRATKAERLPNDRSRLEQVSFTTCDSETPDWLLSARKMTLEHDRGTAVANNLTLKFKGVPLLYFPYARFPIDERRQSGFLAPSIGGTSGNGLDISLPYYFNLRPNVDLTLTPRLISDRGLMLGGEFRYLEPNYRGQIEFTYLNKDDNLGRDRGLYRVNHFQSLTAGWYATADLYRVSDRRYFEDFGDSLNLTAISLLRSAVRVDGRGDWWTFSTEADTYQVIDQLITPDVEPYSRVPRVYYAAETQNANGPVFGLRTEAVGFDRAVGVTGSRVDVQPYVSWPVVRPAYYLTPTLAYRYTSYDLDRGRDTRPDRALPIVSLEGGLLFDRSARWFGRSANQTLEPQAFYLYAPYRDQDDIPVFDTGELTFSFGQLFRGNRFSGADRQQDANQLSLALTSRISEDSTGIERLSASVGQIFYFRDQRVQLPSVAATTLTRSAYIGEINLGLTEEWTASAGLQWDPELSRTDLGAIRLSRRFADSGIVNLSYRFRRGLIEQIDSSAYLPLNERWKLIGRWNYSLKDRSNLEALAGFEYESCCWAARVLARRYLQNQLGQERSAIYFELEFKGLGSLGRQSEELLERAIAGYRR